MIQLALSMCLFSVAAIADSTDSQRVFLILLDGLRWQEVFGGAEDALMNKENGGVADADMTALRGKYWRDTPEARREALMPFLWTTVATKGQLIGNQNKHCVMRVSNGFNFSYPGYSEMIVGYADPAIDSNGKKPNPNTNVFEFLNSRPAFKGHVAVIGAWDAVPFIVNKERCGFFVNAGIDPITTEVPTPKMELLNRLKAEVPSPWENEPFDAITFHTAMEYIRAQKPHAMWITFGETDEWGHAGNYRNYLDAARRTDAHIRELYVWCEAAPEYRGRTTLIITTDHGRGDAPKGWKGHGKDVKGSHNIWTAIMGPNTPALGERHDTQDMTQAQIAATVAAVVGEDYGAAQRKAAKPIDGAVGKRK